MTTESPSASQLDPAIGEVASSEPHRCDWMDEALRPCPQHGLDCPDVLVLRARAGWYGLPVRDGGGSCVVISFCPGCGHPLDLVEDSEDSAQDAADRPLGP